ncbi:hypothetical protein FB567DRAFT_512617 [Paraphoma chrysanthemicola]|uniref:Secreted protein n=1 Tax=Paraphoma chrysanthemicola TaxID=798071 RepID=A0A8K0W4K7_9PLEO|nr:hypothetical protein FB567DRAFT_512617 [Paraphoma chrysanthemicola]
MRWSLCFASWAPYFFVCSATADPGSVGPGERGSTPWLSRFGVENKPLGGWNGVSPRVTVLCTGAESSLPEGDPVSTLVTKSVALRLEA